MHHLTVVTADRGGLIAEISERLARAGVNISAIGARALGHDAILHVSVDVQDVALAVLTEAGFQVMSEDVVSVQLADAPGALAELARRLSDANLDIRAVRTVRRAEGHAIVALATDDNARARELLKDALA